MGIFGYRDTKWRLNMAILVQNFVGIFFCQNPFSAIWRQKKKKKSSSGGRATKKRPFFAAFLIMYIFLKRCVLLLAAILFQWTNTYKKSNFFVTILFISLREKIHICHRIGSLENQGEIVKLIRRCGSGYFGGVRTRI